MDTDEAQLHELLSTSASGSVHRMTHYVYLRSPGTIRGAAAELSARGFEVVEDRNAMGPGLLLAMQLVIPSREGLRRSRELLEAIAERHGGEYDGWEAEPLSSRDRRAPATAAAAPSDPVGADAPSDPTASRAPPPATRRGPSAPASTG